MYRRNNLNALGIYFCATGATFYYVLTPYVRTRTRALKSHLAYNNNLLWLLQTELKRTLWSRSFYFYDKLYKKYIRTRPERTGAFWSDFSPVLTYMHAHHKHSRFLTFIFMFFNRKIFDISKKIITFA